MGHLRIWDVYQVGRLTTVSSSVCCGFSYSVLMQDCACPQKGLDLAQLLIQLIGNHGNKELKFSQVLLKQDLFLLDIQRCRFVF